jgi:hypothetical protein
VSDDLVIGGQLGNYLIESVIGRGGMSVVYRARHARLGTSVALKVLAPALSSDDAFRERFLREAQMAAGIDHPNAIPIHDMGLHDDSLYIVMRYVSGGDLKALLSTSGTLDAERAVTLLMPVALALDAAHADGLVHRDVKPANILLQRTAAGEVEHVYLTDFGIAKSASNGSGLTRAGGVIGTVEYMAPEQIEGREVSAQTDVYALAATFFECITGRIPFERELAEGARPPVGMLEPISGLRPELPSALDRVIVKALARNPVDRYATCEQFLRACSYVLESRSEPGLTPETVAPTALSPADAIDAGGERPPRAGGPDAESARPSVEPDHGVAGTGAHKRRWYAIPLVAVIGGAVAAVVLTSSPTSQAGARSSSVLQAVPTNRVTGSGTATVRLSGNTASVTVTTEGLDGDAALVHAVHIHGGGKGECPPVSAARLHNGNLSISTTDGINYYGPPVQALTTYGDTSVSSILAFPRFLSGGTIHYTRTITLPPEVAAYVRENNAVIVVHGVNYDGSGIYSGVLDRSELNKSVPGTATAPALCGRLVGPQRVAALDPRSVGHPLVYTASFTAYQSAQSGTTGGLFACHVGDSIAPGAAVPGAARRRLRPRTRATA